MPNFMFKFLRIEIFYVERNLSHLFLGSRYKVYKLFHHRIKKT